MEELDLKELFDMIWSRRTTIILILLICAVIGFIYTMNFIKPEYSTSTTLLLASTNNTGNSNNTVTVGDITVNSKLVSTYSRLIKSRKVIDQVNSNLSMTVNTGNISVNSTKRNRIN